MEMLAGRSTCQSWLLFQNFDAQVVRRVDVDLIEAAVVSRLCRHARRLPLCHLLLHVVDDETELTTDPRLRPLGGGEPGAPSRMTMRPGNNTR